MRDSANSLRLTFSPLLDPPIPLAAVWAVGTMTARVTFNHPLVPSPALNTDNWFLRFNNFSLNIVLVRIVAGTPTVVRLTVSGQAINAGPDIVSFFPPPFDVVSNTAVQVAAPAFTDFPLGV